MALKQFKGWVTSDGCPQDEMNNYLNAGEHPNLIAVKARLKDCDLPGLVMELVPASFSVLGQPPSFDTCTRDTFTQGQSLTLAQLKQLAEQVARGHGPFASKADLPWRLVCPQYAGAMQGSNCIWATLEQRQR